MSRKTIFFTSFLLILAGISSWLTLNTVKDNTSQHVNKPENADSFMTNVVYTKTNENGIVSSIIKAKKIIHYPYKSASVFQKPNILLTTNQNESWQITAEKGTSEQNTKIIYLSGNVKFYQPGSSNKPATTITTSDATIYPDNNIAYTKSPVITEKGSVKIQATGAQVDLDKSLFNLLSNISQTYTPNKEESGTDLPLSGDNQEIAHLKANQATYDRQNHLSTYIGNIQFVQGQTYLLANKVLIYDDTNNNIYKIVAFGTPAHYSTIAKGSTNRMDAIADRIEYYPDKKLAILIGHGEITKKGDRFVAPYITYDLTKQVITSKRSDTKNENTVITITP